MTIIMIRTTAHRATTTPAISAELFELLPADVDGTAHGTHN